MAVAGRLRSRDRKPVIQQTHRRNELPPSHANIRCSTAIPGRVTGGTPAIPGQKTCHPTNPSQEQVQVFSSAKGVAFKTSIGLPVMRQQPGLENQRDHYGINTIPIRVRTVAGNHQTYSINCPRLNSQNESIPQNQQSQNQTSA